MKIIILPIVGTKIKMKYVIVYLNIRAESLQAF